jgi:type II secretory pathway pseudopilin PulG
LLDVVGLAGYTYGACGYLKNMFIRNNTKWLKHAFSLVEILGAVAVLATLATVSIISIKDTVQASQRSAAQRELQKLNTALQNFKSAGGVIRENATAEEAIRDLRGGVDLAGSELNSLVSDPPMSVDIGGEEFILAYDPEEGFSYVNEDGEGLGGGGGGLGGGSAPFGSSGTWGSSSWNNSVEGVTGFLDQLRNGHIAGLEVPEADALAAALVSMPPEVGDLIVATMADLGWSFDPNSMNWVKNIPEFDFSTLPDPAPLLEAYTNSSNKVGYFAGLTSSQQASLFGALDEYERMTATTSFFYMPYPKIIMGSAYWEAQQNFKNFLNTLPEGYAGLALNSLNLGDQVGIDYPSMRSALGGMDFQGMNLWGFDTRGKIHG